MAGVASEPGGAPSGAAAVKLARRGDALVLVRDGADSDPVRLVWARPMSGRGREVAVMSKDRKELAMIEDLDWLDPESRALAEEELARRYMAPRILRVTRAVVNFGSRYWDVETDRGPRRFMMRDPNKNVFWVSEGHAIIRDTLGNRYELPSVATLDPASQAWINRVL